MAANLDCPIEGHPSVSLSHCAPDHLSEDAAVVVGGGLAAEQGPHGDRRNQQLRSGEDVDSCTQFTTCMCTIEHHADAAACTVKGLRGLATRYDKLAIVYHCAAVIRAVTLWLPHLSGTP
jgi:hypothetical protein